VQSVFGRRYNLMASFMTGTNAITSRNGTYDVERTLSLLILFSTRMPKGDFLLVIDPLLSRKGAGMCPESINRLLKTKVALPRARDVEPAVHATTSSSRFCLLA